MANTISVTGSISLVNASGVSQASYAFQPLTATANAYTEALYTVGTATSTVTLPTATITSALVYNGNASNTLTVNWTPAGGSTETVVVLQPLSQINFIGGAITAMTLVANGASTNATVIVGG